MAGELGEIGIAVSLLTGFEPVAYENEEDLLAKVNAGVDGLVIRDGSRQGLFCLRSGSSCRTRGIFEQFKTEGRDEPQLLVKCN